MGGGRGTLDPTRPLPGPSGLGSGISSAGWFPPSVGRLEQKLAFNAVTLLPFERSRSPVPCKCD